MVKKKFSENVRDNSFEIKVLFHNILINRYKTI